MRRRLASLLLIPALALGAAGCGDDDEETRQGGKLTVINSGDIESLDPGATYYQADYIVHYAVHRPLYSYKPDDLNPTPDLAETPPAVSEDGRRLTIKLKSGVRFSPPVDREVTSADVKYALERAFMGGVDNGYVSTYFADIEGAPEVGGEYTEIPGIRTPDERTLTIELTRPTAGVVAQALVLPASAPVPKEYAERYDQREPNEYGMHQVFTGPYMIENDDSGELTGYDPGRRVKLVRNPNWERDTDYRPAPLDEIEVRPGNEDIAAASRMVLEGDGMVTGDIIPDGPSVDRAQSSFEDQVEIAASGGYRYVPMNTTVEPFDDLNVRRAVVAAMDREALRRPRGGPAAGDVANHYIPPDFPGFEESGGADGFEVDFLASPRGNPDLAADYMRRAGFESGRYEGDEQILVVAEDEPPGSDTALIVRDTLTDLGFDVDFRQVDFDTMNERFCGVPAADVAVCPNFGWTKDFNDPQAILAPVFSGDAIVETNNANWSQLDDPEIDRAMEEAELLTDPVARARAWAEINRMIVESAAGIPWLWDTQANLRSDDVAGVINKANATWDLSFTGLKE